ncbi:MAG: FliM/FliN family flagellar motor switch protein [Acidimicrobiia bacterium]|nr:FliM/FliN family flagellar motor switch protein [Acidimicrobiia bacterium]
MRSATPEADRPVADGVPYVFGRPSQLSDEKAHLYRDAAEQIAIEGEAAIGQWMPGCTIEAGPVSEFEPGEPLVTDEAGHDLVPLVADVVPCGILSTELSLGLMLVSGTLGGGSKGEIPPRPLTSIEIRVLDLVTTSFLAVASRVLLVDEMTIQRGRSEGFRATDDDTPKARIGFTFTVQGPREEGRLVLGVDADALQTFSDAIDRRLSGNRPTAPTQPSPLTALALQPVPLYLTVGVGRAELTAREVVELRAGDVIRTRVPVTADLVASAGDRDLFKVQVVQRGRQLTAEILAPITAESGR